ncbi:MAG: site-specific DNA-methyltransferase [Bacteroidetes bacterium]|nr:site-specific DNA-methyltransferase [Bacteroidota bacterium]
MTKENKLFYGDNLQVLRKKIGSESIDLCYIDPPFNSKRNYNQIYNNIGQEDQAQAQAFIDTWTWDEAAEQGIEEIISNEGGVFPVQTIELIIGLEKVLNKGSLLSYLVSMSLRIAEIYRVLKPTGSFYLHCDPAASHYLKLIIDSIFCSRKGEYQNEIIWRRTGQHNKVSRYGPIHDVIFFYTKTDKYTWNNPKRPYMKGHILENFIRDDRGYRTNYYGNVLTGSGIRGGESGKPWRGFDPTAKGRHWAIPGAVIDDIDEDLSELSQHAKLDRLFELGFITIKEGEAWPIYNRYLKPSDGQVLSDIWAFQPYTKGTVFQTEEGIDEDVRWLSTKDSERLGYPTQKPEGLLERIIKASSNEGDTILDAYCGCGTTVAVAQNLDRKWIGIDITYQSISLILKRLEEAYDSKILERIELDGVPKDFKSAVALANKQEDKTRKEFEKWITLTFSNNKAVINEKKGGDGGIDGIAYLIDVDKNNKKKYEKVIFSVKSNKTLSPTVVRDLNGTIEREGAALGYLLTLYPMDNLVKESKKYGVYKNIAFNHTYPKIEVISVEEILAGKRMILPTGVNVVREAKKKNKGKKDQGSLDLDA